ncbi:MAG: RHS repeat domain-containing protein, partial [Lysinibacillus sp.]
MKKIAVVCMLLIGFVFSSSPIAQAASYKYDDRDRLVEVTYDDGKYIKYTYDAAGNIIEQQYYNGETVEKYTYFQPSYDVSTTKQWKIGFNKKLNAATVNMDTVYVLEVET